MRGAIFRAIGRTDNAESDLLQAMSLRPESNEMRSTLIELYLDNGESSKALNLLNEETDRRPQDPMSYLQLADVHRLQGRNDKAIESVGLALELDPNIPRAYLRLGELWLDEGLRRGDRVAMEKAVAALESVAKMDPNDGRAALALGRAFIAMGEEERGFTELQRAAEATPIQAEAHRILGDLYRGRGNHTEAITAYHIYIKLEGEAPSVLERLGDTYQEMDNLGMAAETYLRLAGIEPGRVLPYIKAARFYLMAGDPVLAEQVCRQGLSSNPENQNLMNLLAQTTR